MLLKVPVPAFVARLLQTEIGYRDGSALLFESTRGGYLTLGQARYTFTKATEAVEGCDGVRPCTTFATRAPRWRSAPGRT